MKGFLVYVKPEQSKILQKVLKVLEMHPPVIPSPVIEMLVKLSYSLDAMSSWQI